MPTAGWRPDYALQVAFNADPNDPNATPTWTNLTSLLRKASGVRRGRQYELDQNQAAQPTLTFWDPNEYLNPANGSSPYSPNVVPYRQILWQAMWPNGGTGNLLNTGAQGTSYDPSFESYTTGAAVSWITAVGGTTPVIGTTTPHAGTKDLTWSVVNGATIQGVSWLLPCIPGRQYTTSTYVRQTSASTQRIAIAGVATGSSTATTGAYVRLTVTWTATQPSHTVTVQTTGTAVAGTVLLDDVQHEPGASATTFTTSGPVIYGILREYVERWPSTWDPDSAGFLGLCEATLVDAFAPQNKTTLWSEYRNSVLAKAPAYYWPLGEPQGSTSFGEVSGNQGPSMTPLVSIYGAGNGLAVGTSTNIPGDPSGTGVKIQPWATGSGQEPATILSVGSVSGLLTGPPISWPGNITPPWGASWAAWVNMSPQTNGDTFEYLLANGFAFIWTVVGTGTRCQGGQQIATWSTSIADGTNHHVAMTYTTDGSSETVTLYVDGVSRATATGSPFLPYFSETYMLVGGYVLTIISDDLLNGWVAHIAAWNRTLTSAEVLDLYTAGTGYPGESSGARVTRYLGYGWTGLSSIDTGQSVMGVSDLAAGTTLLAANQAVATTENGNYWQDSRGSVQFAARTRQYLAITSKYTFGENTAGGEFPYQGDIGYDLDPTLVYNDVTVTNAGGIKAQAIDSASQTKYFPNAYSRDVNVLSNNEAIDAANYLLNQHALPQQRVQQITLDPVGNPNLWPVVLSLELGDRVTVKRRAKAANSGAGITMSADFFVGSISHDNIDMDAGTWTTTLLLYPVDIIQVGILNDATLGLLDSTFVLAY